MARIIDLTHAIEDGMASYPGDPPVRVRDWQRYEHGYFVSRLELGTHAGTHVDAPAHRIEGGKSVVGMGIGAYIGFRTAVLDLSSAFVGLGGEAPCLIDAAALAPFGRALEGCDGALIKTGWSSRWGGMGFFQGYPSLSEDAALFFARLGVHIIGVEPPSVSEGRHLEVHDALLGRGIAIVESVACMDEIGAAHVAFHAVPLKLAGRDGSPARAYAIESG